MTSQYSTVAIGWPVGVEYVVVSWNRGTPWYPQIINLNGSFHYKPSMFDTSMYGKPHVETLETSSYQQLILLLMTVPCWSSGFDTNPNDIQEKQAALLMFVV